MWSVQLWALCHFTYGRIKWGPGEQEAEQWSQAALLPSLEIPCCVFFTSTTMEGNLAASLCMCELSRVVDATLVLKKHQLPSTFMTSCVEVLGPANPSKPINLIFLHKLLWNLDATQYKGPHSFCFFKTKPGQNFASKVLKTCKCNLNKEKNLKAILATYNLWNLHIFKMHNVQHRCTSNIKHFLQWGGQSSSTVSSRAAPFSTHFSTPFF